MGLLAILEGRMEERRVRTTLPCRDRRMRYLLSCQCFILHDESEASYVIAIASLG